MLLRESLGISADGTEKAFPTTEIEAFMQRTPPAITHDIRRPTENTQHVFVACDPSGGGASAFSIVSIAQDSRGFLNVRIVLNDLNPFSPLRCFHILRTEFLPLLALRVRLARDQRDPRGRLQPAQVSLAPHVAQHTHEHH